MQDKPDFGKRTPGEGGGDLKQEAKDQLRKGAEQISEEAKGRAESMKSQATEQVQRTASALGSAAEEFESQGQETLARMLAELASNLGDLAKRVENKSLDELVREGGRLAERNPLMFVAGSVAAGVLLTRFFKAHDTSGSTRQEFGQSPGSPGSPGSYDDRAGAYGGESPYGRERAFGSGSTATYGGATAGTSAYGRTERDQSSTGDGGER